MKLPRVTGIIAAFFPPSQFYTGAGRDEGTALHACCHYLSEGDLDWATVDTAILPRVRQFERFLADTGYQAKFNEMRLTHPVMGYTGTIDSIGILGGRLVLVDYKRGAFLPTVKLQTAAYKRLAVSNGYAVTARHSLHLGEDGYKLIAHTDIADENRWAALVAAYAVIHPYQQKKK